MNASEQKFLDVWKEHGIPNSDPENQWSHEDLVSEAGRRYKYDFAWPLVRVLIEIQGHGFGHLTPKNRARDARKARVAMAHGYTVIPVTTDCLGSKAKQVEVCEQIESILDRFANWGE